MCSPCIVVPVTNPSDDYENILEHMEQLQEWPLDSWVLIKVILIHLVIFCLGCHVIAPSDMMDNRVAAIKDLLHKNGFGGKVCCGDNLITS